MFEIENQRLLELAGLLTPLLRVNRDIRYSTINLGGVERIVLELEVNAGSSRRMRITPTESTSPEWHFEVLWSLYGNDEKETARDGRFGGDAGLVVTAAWHWLVDRLPWMEVPEFRKPLTT